jgi:predicted DNA-binding transcriptional regulator AlpA
VARGYKPPVPSRRRSQEVELSQLITLPQIAKRLGITRMAAFNLMEAGKLPKPLGRVGRTWVFNAAKVESFLQRRAKNP